jgi:hypothetical protein
MFAASLIGQKGWYSTRCRLTWNLQGTKSFRLYFQLAPSTLPTDETGFGLLLTPTAVQTCEHPEDMQARAKAKGYKNGTKFGSLTSQVVHGMLPTPTTQEPTSNCEITETGRRKTKDGKGSHSLNLGRVVTMLPTPTTGADHGTPYQQGGESLRCRLGQTSQLNPRFVAEMMGFPANWTESPFQSGETKASKHTETR